MWVQIVLVLLEILTMVIAEKDVYFLQFQDDLNFFVNIEDLYFKKKVTGAKKLIKVENKNILIKTLNNKEKKLTVKKKIYSKSVLDSSKILAFGDKIYSKSDLKWPLPYITYITSDSKLGLGLYNIKQIDDFDSVLVHSKIYYEQAVIFEEKNLKKGMILVKATKLIPTKNSANLIEIYDVRYPVYSIENKLEETCSSTLYIDEEKIVILCWIDISKQKNTEKNFRVVIKTYSTIDHFVISSVYEDFLLNSNFMIRENIRLSGVASYLERKSSYELVIYSSGTSFIAVFEMLDNKIYKKLYPNNQRLHFSYANRLVYLISKENSEEYQDIIIEKITAIKESNFIVQEKKKLMIN